MKPPHPARAWLTLCLLTATLGQAVPLEVWVAPDGSDANAGTREAPLANPSRALRSVREARRLQQPQVAEGARILLRGGVYHLEEPLLVRPEDSGTAQSPTTIEAAPGEDVVLSGGVRLGAWKKPAEPVPGLPAAARDHVWVADSATFNGRTVETRVLWVADRKATRARTPNDGAMDSLQAWNRPERWAGIAPGLLPAGEDVQGLEMIVQQQWETAVLRVKAARIGERVARLAFHSPESRLEFEHPWPQPILKPEGAGAFFLANRIEFLDQPGEWHQEASGRILYWPRHDEQPARAEAAVPALETLVEIAGTPDRPVSHVQFKGIRFQHTAWQRPSLSGHVPLQLGLYFLDAYGLKPPGTPDWHKLDNQAWLGRPPAAFHAVAAHHVVIERCRFEHLAMNAVDFGAGTTDNRIEGCVFHDLGGNGLLMGVFSEGGVEAHLPYEPADERELCARNRIANNLIVDCGNEDWGCAPIAVGFARDVSVAHNEIRQAPYSGISVGWGWTRTLHAARNHRIHANRIEQVGTRVCDLAGIYSLSAQPGTQITENVVRGIRMSPYVDRPDHWFYYYLDEGSSYVLVKDNACPEERFLQNANGPGNVWENNGPAVAQEIQDRAGLEPAYQDLRHTVP